MEAGFEAQRELNFEAHNRWVLKHIWELDLRHNGSWI